MKTMRPLFRISLAVALLALVVWYCKPEPKTGVLNIRIDAAATIINPLLRSTGYSGFVASQVFQTFGILEPESLVLKPNLSKVIPEPRKVTEGAHQGELAYDLEIQESAKWDNGSPITGEDFVFTLKLILDQGLNTSAYRGYYEYLTGADVDPANPRKITVYMRQFYIMAQEALCMTPVYPIYNYDPQGRLKNVSLADLLDPAKNKAFAESAEGKAFADEFQAPKFSNDAQFISGSGPYRLKSMNGDQGVILIKKKDWWSDNSNDPLLRAYPEELVYKIVKNEGAVQSLLETGDLDIVTDLSPALFKEMQRDTHLTRLYDFKTGWAPRYGRLLLNLQQADTNLLTDIRVRRALAYAIDYDYLINTVQQGFAQQVVGPIHPKKPYYAKDVPLYTNNVAEAQRLLAEAGWKDSDNDGVLDKMVNGKRIPLSLTLMTPGSVPVSEMVANSIRDKARQVMIDIVLLPQDISNITKKTIAGQFQMAAIGANTQTGLDELNQYYYSESPENRGRYRNTRLDTIIDQIRVSENVAQRNALYIEAQRILHDDVPVIFLYTSARRYIISKKFNYVLTAAGSGYYEQLFQRNAAFQE